MIGWLLDTNVVSALINPSGAPSVKQWAASQDEHLFHLSILTIGEYEKGIANLPPDSADRRRHMASRDALIARFGPRLLPVSDGVVRRWGVISGTVRRDTGHPPPVIDTLLAATALEAELYLVTRNGKDVRHSGAAVFDPWTDDPARFPVSRKRRGHRPG
ncbi:type II toxin-antitoxin system VapC family toxin [Indioceanicola profundi]|uniref:type II toxin-antitoxin system VapC family toxin n=1 Tax=Indioceanicola profundi TaxID=2220096 RepID=UPI000E6AB359|nr:type II toxin-antitoxin system VapC family toxin [Indioceanicola profundi]